MVRWAAAAVLVFVSGCAGSLSSRVVTQVRHDYHCGLVGIDGHLVSHGETEDVYDVTECHGTHLTVTCPTDAHGRFQRCTYGPGTTVTVAAREEPVVESGSGSERASESGSERASESGSESASESGSGSGSETVSAVAEPPAASSAEASARAAIDARRAALLACTGGAAAIRVDWTADGALTATLRDARDSDEERCVQAALAGATIDAGGSAGTALHAIAP